MNSVERSKIISTSFYRAIKSLMCPIFNEKLEFHETTFRIPQINFAFSSILLINSILQNKKRKK